MCSTVAAMFSNAVHAQSVAALPEVVVTANRVQTRADQVIADVTLISREQIEQGMGRTVAEVLARSGGIQLGSNGGLGNSSSVFVRGTESRHVLLLVDGVRYGSSTLGAPNWDSIPLEMIDRIEVLKGPASALYGSDAVGGVVQIFTRKGRTGLGSFIPFIPYGSLTVGQNERRELSAGASGGTSEFHYAFGLQTLRDKGFSATNPQVAFNSFNPDSDGFSQNSGNASLQWKLTPALTLGANLLRAEGVNHSDKGPDPYDVHTNFVTQVSGLRAKYQVQEAWNTSLQLGSSADRSNYFSSPSPDIINTAKDQWTWQNELKTPVGLLLAGVENLTERVSGTTAYTVNQRSTDSVFAGLHGKHAAHSWQVNARHDDNSQFGVANTGLAGYAYQFTPEWRVRASVGTSFKAPSFNALYWPDYGNSTIQPETGRNTEAGLNYANDVVHGGVTYFVNRIQGFITILPAVSNVPFARMEGWSLDAGGNLGAFDYRAQLDLLKAENELTGKRLARRPDRQLTLSGDYAWGAWKFGANWLMASDSYDDAANTLVLDGYGTVDLYARHALKPGWHVEGKLVNAGDKTYQTINGYNQPGRSAYLTLRYSPQ